MNILFISPSYDPFDQHGFGSVQRTNLLLEACSKCGHVDVITFVNDVKSNNDNCSVVYSQELTTPIRHSRLRSTLALFNPWDVYATFPQHDEAARIVSSIVDKAHYDFIVIRYIPEAMKCGLMKYADRLIIDVDDSPLEVTRYSAQTSRRFRKRLYHHLQLLGMQITLNQILSRIKMACYANPTQANHPRSCYLPNIPYYEMSSAECVDFETTTPRVLFFGNLNFGPNADGVTHFVKHIFPIVRATIPNAEFHIGGSCNNHTLRAQWEKIPGVKVLGFVPELQTEYDMARAVVVPIYSGAGTNIKVLEAMQMKRPLVTTPCGMRGFDQDFKNEEHCLVAETDVDFANKIIRVLQDEKLNHELARNAKQQIDNKYTRMVFNRIVSNILITE